MTKIRIFAAAVIAGFTLWTLFSARVPQLNNDLLLATNQNTDEQRSAVAEKVIPLANQIAAPLADKIKSVAAPPPKESSKPRPVPFTAQAPFGDWQDPRLQDGCEEASLVMAWHWLQNTTFTKTQALEEILALSKFEEETIGEWRSTNAADTIRIFREYYHYDNIAVQYDISSDDIKKSLETGNLVLVPTDGRKLGNPYYRQPGPPEHMLVIFDYDQKTDEFITNDPGTRRGQNYRYKSNTVMNAIVDYPTGHREPNPNPQTAMIVIAPKP